MKALEVFQAEANSYKIAYDNCDFVSAKKITRQAVGRLRQTLFEPPDGSSTDFLDGTFRLAVFFRALHDFAEVAEISGHVNWAQKDELVESLWSKFCDCRDRIDLVRHAIRGDFIEQVADILTKIQDFYLAAFCQGHYMSPEIVAKRELCSICLTDLRSCSHISGRIYSGKLCSSILDSDGIRLVSGSLVRVPHDPRCRVWPWNIKNNKSEVMLLSFFRIDDFMEKDDWG